jgi:hypothetical protein
MPRARPERLRKAAWLRVMKKWIERRRGFLLVPQHQPPYFALASKSNAQLRVLGDRGQAVHVAVLFGLVPVLHANGKFVPLPPDDAMPPVTLPRALAMYVPPCTLQRCDELLRQGVRLSAAMDHVLGPYALADRPPSAVQQHLQLCQDLFPDVDLQEEARQVFAQAAAEANTDGM